ncbi:MAG: hypothetical protein GWO20_09945 [Candidatus Korarchaeota archaeon]|nr:hypothetical protein [Candidatus Korarchaeota archaeon]NIU83844.1 hypothetical protein [Candidatus Thorarchaeota archaeon]NIW13986.1 hypothetical protein [Candidatus Thorarchaeota archaeon]NIW53602.1 hypothetical protein [Candidatus Korarchaeota archaeon]
MSKTIKDEKEKRGNPQGDENQKTENLLQTMINEGERLEQLLARLAQVENREILFLLIKKVEQGLERIDRCLQLCQLSKIMWGPLMEFHQWLVKRNKVIRHLRHPTGKVSVLHLRKIVRAKITTLNTQLGKLIECLLDKKLDRLLRGKSEVKLTLLLSKSPSSTYFQVFLQQSLPNREIASH